MAEKEKKAVGTDDSDKDEGRKRKKQYCQCDFRQDRYYHTADPVAVWLSDRGIHVSAGQDVFHRFCREGGSSYSCYLLNK